MAASSSIKTYSLFSQQEVHKSKIRKLTTTCNNTLKPSVIQTPTLFIYTPNKLRPPITMLHHKPKKPYHHLSRNCHQQSNLHKPTSSKNSNIIIKIAAKFWAEKVVVLLVGSFLFMFCFSARSIVVALPIQKSTSSANLELKTEETQSGYNEDEDEDEEEMSMKKLLEENPRNVEALKVVLYGKMRRGKTKEAVEYVERLIYVQPQEVEWRLLQALCCEMMGQFSKAKMLFKTILEERPLFLRALHGLAMVMHKNHEGPAVFEMLNKALEVAHRENRVTEERSIRILIAQMHVVKGELEEGLKRFQDLVDENPRDFRPYLCQGIIYSLLGKKKEAEVQFEIYQSLVPEEFPQRGFLDDVVLSAKTKTQLQLEKEFQTELSYKT